MELPLLRMEKSDLDNVPDIPLPKGYTLRTFREGDEPALAKIYASGDMGTTTAEGVRQRLLGHPCYKPGRVFIVEYASEPVGTGAAWIDYDDPGVGYLHMLGVLPEHRGKRLGAILTIATIHYTRLEGFSAQRLCTKDFREAAIRLYLDLGYYPLYVHESHPARWEALAKKLNRPEAFCRARDMRGR